MSILTNKNVLITGEGNSLLDELSESLEAHGAKVTKISCAKLSPTLLEEQQPDVMLCNCMRASDDEFSATFMILREFATRDPIPVFTLIQDTPETIKDALSLGVTDYITPQEDVRSILAKIKAVFGEGDMFSGNAAIDITPNEAHVTASGIRVFVVEDDPLLRNLLSMKLDRSSFPYEFSNDGSDAVPLMHQFKPDVIILDLMLPGRSGFEVLTEIKADEKLKDVPVIVFSNRDGQEDRQKANELGAKGFYVKAMTDLSELIETIESLVA